MMPLIWDIQKRNNANWKGVITPFEKALLRFERA